MKLHCCLLLALSCLALQAMERPGKLTPKKIQVNLEIVTKQVSRDPIKAAEQAAADKKAVEAVYVAGTTPDIKALYDLLSLSSFHYIEDTAPDQVWLLRKFMHALVQVREIYEQLQKQKTSYESMASKMLLLLNLVADLGYAHTALATIEPKADNFKEIQALKSKKTTSKEAAIGALSAVIEECGNFLTSFTGTLKKELAQAFGELQALDKKYDELYEEVIKIQQTVIPLPSKGNSAKDTKCRMQSYQGLVARRARDLNIKKEDLDQVQRSASLAYKHLGGLLWAYKQKTFHLAGNTGCSQYKMADLPEELILGIFSHLERTIKKDFYDLSMAALQAFKPYERLYKSLIYTLQQYICCAYYEPEKATAKGPAWEIAVALFLHDACKTSHYGKIVAMNDFVQSGSSTAREFDVITDKLLIECKNCKWHWESPGKARDEIAKHGRKKSQLADQLVTQRNIARQNRMRFLLISKQLLDKGWSEWCKSRNISIDYADSVTSKHDFIDALGRLYEKAAFIE